MCNVSKIINDICKCKETSKENKQSSASICFEKALFSFLASPEDTKDKSIADALSNSNYQTAEVLSSQQNKELNNVLFKINKLKRSGWIARKVSSPESVAEHSFGVAKLALMLTPDNLDRNKAVRIALVHDIQEIYAGDFTPHDKISPEEKARIELKAAQKISKDLNCPEMLCLFLEYEKGESKEARFVKDLDRMEAVLQAQYYDNNKRAPELLIPEFLPYAVKKYIGGYDYDIVKNMYSELKQMDDSRIKGISGIISSLNKNNVY